MGERHGSFDEQEIIKQCLTRYVNRSASNPQEKKDPMSCPIKTIKERNTELVTRQEKKLEDRLLRLRLKESRGTKP